MASLWQVARYGANDFEVQCDEKVIVVVKAVPSFDGNRPLPPSEEAKREAHKVASLIAILRNREAAQYDSEVAEKYLAASVTVGALLDPDSPYFRAYRLDQGKKA